MLWSHLAWLWVRNKSYESDRTYAFSLKRPAQKLALCAAGSWLLIMVHGDCFLRPNLFRDPRGGGDESADGI